VPLRARAQQPAMRVVGFIGPTSATMFAIPLQAFHQGLAEAGFVEGRNVAIEYRFAEGHNDRLSDLAADLVRRQVTVIAAAGTPAAVAAKGATTTIPIAFYTAADPIEARLVLSLGRPGANLTGVTSLSGELGPKRLELLHELLPAAKVIAALVNPTSPVVAEILSRNLPAAARTLGVELHILQASTDRDLDTVFAKLAELRAGGLVIGTDAFFTGSSAELAALSVRHRVPAIYQYREFVEAGGVMSYGGSIRDAFRLMGIYTGRILKGEKPADLPVQQATRVELIINMKTAKALGLTFPITLLGRADEVFE
jgi:putative ABC transport system substrate-binding protein